MNKFWFILVYLLLSVRLFADCEINPFPPFPPSPPEFRKGLSVRNTSQGILLSWTGVSHQEGYLVSVCTGADGYKPLATDLTDNSLLVTSLEGPGTYYFQVKAYVKVSGNMVFNGGISGRTVRETSTSAGKPEETVEDPPQMARSSRVPLSNTVVLATSFPSFDGSRSFYSAQHPQVRNPLSPSTAEDGAVVPALLTDAGIEETVSRIYKRTKPVQVASSKAGVTLAPEIPLGSNPARAGKVGAQIPETRVRESRTEMDSSQPELAKNKVGDPRGVTPESHGAVQAAEVPGGAEPITKQINQGLYVLIGVIILGVIYMVFHKESK